MAIHKRDWMREAMAALVSGGVDTITIASLTDKLNVTKGSFYHHFRDMVDFRAQMLEMCQYESVDALIARLEIVPIGLPRLDLLEQLAAENDPLEVALRAWALRDAAARQTLARIDADRIALIAGVFAQCGVAETDPAARLFYAVFIGGLHLLPPFTAEQMQAAFRVIRMHYGLPLQQPG